MPVLCCNTNKYWNAMNTKAHLIYKSVSTRFKTNDPRDTTQEWVMAMHCDFSYDYESDTILTNSLEEIGIEEFMDLADDLEQRIKTIKTFGDFSSNVEAQKYFNANFFKMLSNSKAVKEEIYSYYTEWQL
jgi:hypothetical protein